MAPRGELAFGGPNCGPKSRLRSHRGPPFRQKAQGPRVAPQALRDFHTLAFGFSVGLLRSRLRMPPVSRRWFRMGRVLVATTRGHRVRYQQRAELPGQTLAKRVRGRLPTRRRALRAGSLRPAPLIADHPEQAWTIRRLAEQRREQGDRATGQQALRESNQPRGQQGRSPRGTGAAPRSEAARSAEGESGETHRPGLFAWLPQAGN